MHIALFSLKLRKTRTWQTLKFLFGEEALNISKTNCRSKAASVSNDDLSELPFTDKQGKNVASMRKLLYTTTHVTLCDLINHVETSFVSCQIIPTQNLHEQRKTAKFVLRLWPISRSKTVSMGITNSRQISRETHNSQCTSSLSETEVGTAWEKIQSHNQD